MTRFVTILIITRERYSYSDTDILDSMSVSTTIPKARLKPFREII